MLTYGLVPGRDMRTNWFIKLVEALGQSSGPVPLEMPAIINQDIFTLDWLRVYILLIISFFQRPCRNGFQECSPLFLSLDSIAQHRRHDRLANVGIGTVDLVRTQCAPKTSTDRSHDSVAGESSAMSPSPKVQDNCEAIPRGCRAGPRQVQARVWVTRKV